MPRTTKRQRIVFCDCLDCADIVDTPNDHGAWEAAAKQLPPPRSLLLLLEGFNAASEAETTCEQLCTIDQIALPHFDNVARHGVSFCLASRQGASEPPLCQVLGLSAADTEAGADSSIPNMFKGMQAAVASTSTADLSASKCLGVHACTLLSGQQSSCLMAPLRSVPSSAEQHSDTPDDAEAVELPLPSVDAAAQRVLSMLRVPDQTDGQARGTQRKRNLLDSLPLAEASDAFLPDLDMLLLHIKLTDLLPNADGQGCEAADRSRRAALHWADCLLRSLNCHTGFRDSVLLHVVTSFDSSHLPPGRGLSRGGSRPVVAVGTQTDWLARVTRPKQTWQVLGLQEVQVAEQQPMMVSSCLRGVTRCDELDTYNLEGMLRSAGQGCILAERLIHEVAYKVGRALKYGA